MHQMVYDSSEMVGGAERVLALTQHLYDAAYDPRGWPLFFGHLGEALGGAAPGLFLEERTAAGPGLQLTIGLEPDRGQAYAHCHIDNELRPRIRALPAGSVFVDSDLLDDHALMESEFYQDFLCPQGVFHVAGGIPLNDDTAIGILRVIRPRSAPPFGQDEIELLRLLMPHLTRGLTLHRRLAAMEAARDQGDLLDWLPFGVALLDRRGTVLATNRRADAVFAVRDGLWLDGAGLRASRWAEHMALQQEITRATTDAGDEAGTGALTVTRTEPGRALQVFVAPLRPGQLGRAAHRARVVVFISDPDVAPVVDVERLRAYLGITGAEAALVATLASGLGVEDAAVRLGVTVNTARTQLKRALGKTGARRQSELVGLALGSPAVLTPAPARDGTRRPSSAVARATPRRRA